MPNDDDPKLVTARENRVSGLKRRSALLENNMMTAANARITWDRSLDPLLILVILGGALLPNKEGQRNAASYYCSAKYFSIQGFNSGMSFSIVSQRLSGSIV